MDEVRVGDLVVFKEQNNELYKNGIKGGIVLAITDTHVVLQRHYRPPTVYQKDSIRKIEAADIPEAGVEVV